VTEGLVTNFPAVFTVLP